MAFNFGFSGGGASFSYTNRPFFDFFSFGSIEEIVIFLAVFLMSFAFIYYGLKKFFSEKEGVYQQQVGPGKFVTKGGGMVVKNKGVLLVLSLSMAVLVTFGLMRTGWLFYYLGDIAGMVGLAIVAMLGIVILYGLFEFLEKNFKSTIVAAGVSAVLVWFSYSYILVNNLFAGGPSGKVVEYISSIGGFWFSLIFTIFLVVASKFRDRVKEKPWNV
jgi:hypothetical protein